jgi:hypothetical protein
VRPEPDRSATASAAIPVSGRCCEFLSLVLSVGGVPCRLSYPGSLARNGIGDGVVAVAAAAETMPWLETLQWVLALFPPFPPFPPLSYLHLTVQPLALRYQRHGGPGSPGDRADAPCPDLSRVLCVARAADRPALVTTMASMIGRWRMPSWCVWRRSDRHLE